MKKKFLFLTLLLGILGLVSCVGGGNESSSSSTTHELSTSTSTPSTGTSINKPTSTHIHNYSEEWNNDETNHWHECSCGEKEAQAEHTYGEFVVTKEATHAEDGSKKQECSVCGYENVVVIPKIGHTYATEWSSDATNHWHECSCGEKEAQAEHTYGEFVVTKEATHTEDGSKKQECSVCGYENVVVIPKIGHTYATEWSSDATNHWHECSCGEKEAQAVHTYGEFVIIKEATHTEDGSKKQECSVCGYENTVVIPKLNHELVHHDALSPTCEEAGNVEYYYCSECNKYFNESKEEIETIVVPATGHSYGDLVPALSPTCEEAGNVAYYQCSVCDKYFNESKEEIETIVVPATGHTYGDWNIDETEHWHQCACDHIENRSEHNYENGACKYCGYRYISEGLEFTLSEDETYYIVSISECEDDFINIPSKYLDLPVTIIESSTFEINYIIYGIFIPNSITTIGDYAFASFNKLSTVVFEDNSSLEYIGAYAFGGCQSLENIDLPQDLAIIGEGAFINSSLKQIEIPKSVTEIGESAFYECYSLESVTFAEECMIEALTPYVFYSCNKLSKINIPQSVKKIDAYAFGGCQSLESVNLPQDLAIIGEGAFINSSLKQIEIPKSVTEIGESAFEECYSLESVTFAEECMIEALTPYLFYSCNKLSKINIPQSVTTIGEAAFYNNSALMQIVIPKNLTTIGEEAFYLCNNLLEVYNLSVLTITVGSFDHGYVGAYANKVHTSVQEESIYVDIEDYTFVVIDGEYTLLRYNGNDNNIVLPVIENVNYKIGARAFACKNITTVNISEGVTEIGASAFEGCNNLIQVTLSSTVTAIGDNAFKFCSIYEIYNYSELPLVLKSEDYGFIASTALVIHTKDEESIIVTVDDYLFIYDSDEEMYILLGYNGPDKEIVLPEYINEKAYFISNISFNKDILSVVIPATVIDIYTYVFKNLESVQRIEIHAKIKIINNGMFSDLRELTEIYIPNTVESINSGAFYNCTKLENVIFEENSRLSVIQSNAFSQCSSLKEITLPDSVKNIYQYCFTECGLIKFTTPANLEVIEIGLFERCMNLEEVVIGSNVTKINNIAFVGCKKLNNVIFEENSKLQYIGVNAFSNTGIVNFTIPSSVTKIDQYPFYGCEKLEKLSFEDGIEITSLYGILNESNKNFKEIKIPKNVVEIDSYLFSGLYNLETVVFESDSKLEKISSGAFQNTKLKNIIFPKGLISIGDHAFYNCINLVSVDFEEGSSLETIDSYAFYNCEKLTNVSLPDTLTTMKNNVFEGCKSLININIPKSLTEISNGLFLSCESLEKIELNNKITRIGHNAFKKCSSLEGIVIPASVTEIGDYAFNMCSKLNSITFEKEIELESIGDYAFSGCSSLNEIIIPSTVTSIGSNAFDGCDNLKIYCASNIHKYGDFIVIEEATHTEDGSKSQVCVICGYENTVVIPKLNHDLVHHDALSPTCEEAGNVEYYYCSECNKYFNESKEEIETIVVPATGHSYGTSSWTWNEYSSATAKFICGNDAAHIQEVTATITSEVTTNPTCEGTGVRTYTATVTFGGVEYTDIKTEEITATGHSYGELVSAVSPTCEEEGNVAYYHCSECGKYFNVNKEEIDEIVVEALGHSFTKYTSNNDATCTEDGTKSATCDHYGCSETDTITDVDSKIPHNWEDNVCTACGYDAGGSKGLSWTLVSETNSYTVTGYGACLDTEVTIPKTYNGLPVTAIGSDAFKNQSTITNIAIPKGIVTIGSRAFEGCKGITSIVIPEGVTVISSNLFNNCTGLTEVILSEGITSIDEYAFYSCSALSEIAIPSTVKSYGTYAFYLCSSLLSITLPDGADSIPNYLFQNCYKLKEVDLPNSIKYIGKYAFCSTDIRNIELPNGLEEIDGYAFRSCDFESLLIPNSVTKIGSYAFSYCGELVEATLSNSIKEISTGIFSNCSKLMIVNLPDGIESISTAAFGNCFYLENITLPSSLKEIGACAFQYCCSLKTFVLPEGLVKIGSEAFKYCVSLKNINIPNNLIELGTNVFLDANDLEYNVVDGAKYLGNIFCGVIDKTKSEYTINPTTKFILDYAFENCSNLVSVSIPDSVLCIGSYAFKNCCSLETIKFSKNIKTFSAGLLYGCSSLTTIEIPEGITIIETNAIQNCTNLRSIIMPNSLEKLESGAINQCPKLTSIKIGSGLKNYYYGINGCNKLLEVFNGGTEELNSTYLGSPLCIYNSLDAESKLIKDANGFVFYKDDNENMFLVDYVGGENEIVLPTLDDNKTYEIYKYAFSNYTRLTKITIPSCVTKIQDNAFLNCYNLLEIKDESSLTITTGSTSNGSIGKYALYVNVEGSAFTTDENGYVFYEDENNNIYLVGYKGNKTNLVLPTLAENKTYSIYKYAFYNCIMLRSVEIPNCVTSIGDYAFYNCSMIESIDLPDSLTSIGTYAFSGCTSMRNLSFGSGELSIGNYAFSNCGLTSLNVPNTIVSLGEYVFAECISLISVSLDCETTGVKMFNMCTSLTDVTIENNVQTMSRYLFYNCTNLRNVTIGNSVTRIYDNVFSDCYSLENIVIPDNVTKMDYNAFYYCIKLQNVSLGNGITVLDGVFTYCYSLKNIVFGSGLTKIWYATLQYSNFIENVYYVGTSEEWKNVDLGYSNGNLLEATVYFYSETEPSLNEEGTAYDDNYWHYVDGEVVVWSKSEI